MAKKTAQIPEDWSPPKLRAARERKGWNRARLAGEIDVRENTVENWESGRTRPNLREFLRVLRALDLEFWDLMP